MRIFLDTNVFLYAVGRPHPYRAPCREVLRCVRDGSLSPVVDVEVPQEILHVLRRRRRHDEALEMARLVLASPFEVVDVTAPVISATCDFLERWPGLPTRDALHAAAMKHGGVDRILTADRDFDRIEGIERLDPLEFEPA